MLSWLKPKESTIEQLLAQRDACIGASAEAQASASRAEELALDDPGKHAKTLAKARIDAAEAVLAVELATKVVFRRVSGLADAAVSRLLTERERLLISVSAETQARLDAAQATVDSLAEQLRVAQQRRDGMQRELDGIQQAANELEERAARLRRERDEAVQLDLDDDEHGYHRRRLLLAASRFEEIQP